MKRLLYAILGPIYTWLAKQYNQTKTYTYSVLHPYRYDAERYKDTFLANTCNVNKISTEPVERVIYIFWTGDNEITPNRLKGIHSLEKVAGVEVRLITPKNLSQYILADDPLPEAFQYLSFVHKSDYLRSYFMCHYGGGYADIKIHTHSWVNAFEKLDASPSAYGIGYPEVGFWGACFLGIPKGCLKRDVRIYWRYLIGNCAFIFRPNTPLVKEWHAEAKRRVEALTEELRKHPAQDAYGTNPDYPVVWASIMGEILHPLCLKYNNYLLKDKALTPSFKNYR